MGLLPDILLFLYPVLVLRISAESCSVMGFFPNRKIRSLWKNVQRIGRKTAQMVVFLYGIEICISTKCIFFIEISCVSPKIWIVLEHLLVYSEAVKIGHIKSCKGYVKSYIRLCNIVAEEKSLFRKPLLKLVKSVKYQLISILISLLALGKTSLVDTIVDIVKDKCVELINLIPQFLRV